MFVTVSTGGTTFSGELFLSAFWVHPTIKRVLAINRVIRICFMVFMVIIYME